MLQKHEETADVWFLVIEFWCNVATKLYNGNPLIAGRFRRFLTPLTPQGLKDLSGGEFVWMGYEKEMKSKPN